MTVLLVLSLSCCESSSKATSGGSSGSGEAVQAEGGRPAAMVQALARGKKENKVVVIEYFDPECNYAVEMQGSLAQKVVLEQMKDMVHVKVQPDAVGVVEEFGLMESPTFLFFTPSGEYIEPFIQGFRGPNLFSLELKNYKLLAAGKEAVPIPEDHPDYNHPHFGLG